MGNSLSGSLGVRPWRPCPDKRRAGCCRTDGPAMKLPSLPGWCSWKGSWWLLATVRVSTWIHRDSRQSGEGHASKEGEAPLEAGGEWVERRKEGESGSHTTKEETTTRGTKLSLPWQEQPSATTSSCLYWGNTRTKVAENWGELLLEEDTKRESEDHSWWKRTAKKSPWSGRKWNTMLYIQLNILTKHLVVRRNNFYWNI